MRMMPCAVSYIFAVYGTQVAYSAACRVLNVFLVVDLGSVGNARAVEVYDLSRPCQLVRAGQGFQPRQPAWERPS